MSRPWYGFARHVKPCEVHGGYFCFHAAVDVSLVCPDCGNLTDDGECCGECLSERANYYVPDEREG